MRKKAGWNGEKWRRDSDLAMKAVGLAIERLSVAKDARYE